MTCPTPQLAQVTGEGVSPRMRRLLILARAAALARHFLALRLVAVPARLGPERTLKVFGEPLFGLLLGVRICRELVY